MALPKRRHSKSRTRKRRANWKLNAVQLIPCPQCRHLKLPHHVCSFCGYYAGRQVIEIKKKKKKKR